LVRRPTITPGQGGLNDGGGVTGWCVGPAQGPRGPERGPRKVREELGFRDHGDGGSPTVAHALQRGEHGID